MATQDVPKSLEDRTEAGISRRHYIEDALKGDVMQILNCSVGDDLIEHVFHKALQKVKTLRKKSFFTPPTFEKVITHVIADILKDVGGSSVNSRLLPGTGARKHGRGGVSRPSEGTSAVPFPLSSKEKEAFRNFSNSISTCPSEKYRSEYANLNKVGVVKFKEWVRTVCSGAQSLEGYDCRVVLSYVDLITQGKTFRAAYKVLNDEFESHYSSNDLSTLREQLCKKFLALPITGKK